jgi:L-lactate dehydrogenase complex protein LldF
MKSWVVNTFVKEWKKNRKELEFPKKSFNQMWKEQNKRS